YLHNEHGVTYEEEFIDSLGATEASFYNYVWENSYYKRVIISILSNNNVYDVEFLNNWTTLSIGTLETALRGLRSLPIFKEGQGRYIYEIEPPYLEMLEKFLKFDLDITSKQAKSLLTRTGDKFYQDVKNIFDKALNETGQSATLSNSPSTKQLVYLIVVLSSIFQLKE